MQWIAVATPPFGSIEQFDQLTSTLGGEPEGLQARYVGSAGDQLCVVSLWESQEDADRFFAERLGPALAKILGPDPAGTPEVRGMEVVRAYTRQPVG
jgi:heme-degrading monooxygenase HmoA